MSLILLAEYAEKHHKSVSAVFDKVKRGNVPTAVKIGRQWFVDEDAPYTDRRIKSGLYVGARKRKEKLEPD